MTDARLQQAADLIRAVHAEYAEYGIDGASLAMIEVRHRLGIAHDAVTQADALLTDALQPHEVCGVDGGRRCRTCVAQGPTSCAAGRWDTTAASGP